MVALAMSICILTKPHELVNVCIMQMDQKKRGQENINNMSFDG